MKAQELRRLLQKTAEAANELISSFRQMVDNIDKKRERALLEKIKTALFEYKTQKAMCEKNNLVVKINIEPAAVKIKTLNIPFEILLTKQDLKILQKMKISID